MDHHGGDAGPCRPTCRSSRRLPKASRKYLVPIRVPLFIEYRLGSVCAIGWHIRGSNGCTCCACRPTRVALVACGRAIANFERPLPKLPPETSSRNFRNYEPSGESPSVCFKAVCTGAPASATASACAPASLRCMSRPRVQCVLMRNPKASGVDEAAVPTARTWDAGDSTDATEPDAKRARVSEPSA